MASSVVRYAAAMITTDSVRRQHDAALAMSSRLCDLIDSYRRNRDAEAITLQLSRLVRLLRIHLAQEDVQHYAALATSDDPAVARIAFSYANDMGDLAVDIETFARHWSCSASITGSFDEFRDDAHALLLALAVRIEREDRFLYSLAEQMAAGEQRNAA